MDIKDISKEYQGEDLIIVWQPKKCIHSEKCWRGLPEVFRYGQKPWVVPDGATTGSIVNQIDQCPSGALSYKMKNKETQTKSTMVKINLAENGPLLVKGNVEITLKDGTIKEEKNTALCRCGASSNKPYCDGTHSKINFEA